MRTNVFGVIASGWTVVSGVASFAGAQPSIEFRIVERTGQTLVTPGDNVLDFAVQVRTVTNFRIAAAGFDMRIIGESESSGVLTRGRISNFDGTYFDGIAISNTVGLGGVARHFGYHTNLNSAFNGLINTSAATFTNGPDQEIGLVIASSIGEYLLGTPGLDADGDGNPDTWSGNGTGVTPTVSSTATVPLALRGPYFGQNMFIDLYRFRYTVTNLSPRTLDFSLRNLGGNVFQTLTYAPGQWGPRSSSADLFATDLQIQVIPAPAATLALALGIPVCLRRRR